MRHNKVRAAVLRLMERAEIPVLEGETSADHWEATYFHIINPPRLYRAVAWHGEVGLMDGYVRGDWDSNRPDDLFCALLAAGATKVTANTAALWWPLLRYHLWPTALSYLPWRNPQSPRRARRAITRHYDVGGGRFSRELYKYMLGERMIYSCAYWTGVGNLADAQKQKLELLCRKLNLRAGMRVLDVGCGWGDTAAYMARHYGVHVVGITLSEAQLMLALSRHQDLIQEGRLEFRLQDYRFIPADEAYDAIVSVGMMEHVGLRNYDCFMAAMRSHLAPGGLFLLHTIASRRSNRSGDPWLGRNIFPDHKLPSHRQLARAAEPHLRELHSEDIGWHYDPTLKAWQRNFTEAWPSRLKPMYEELYGSAAARRFYRIWTLYLLSCAGAFRCGHIGVLQKTYARLL